MEKTNGKCFWCGKESLPVAMKNHVLKTHCKEGDEPCYLFLAEGIGLGTPNHYWVLADVAKGKSLSTIDTFLRNIWLECCGHLSQFKTASGGAVGKARKITDVEPGDRLFFEYDFGSTTIVRITFLAETVRLKQRHSVRILARNNQPIIKCKSCGKEAAFVCCGCGGMYDEMFFCDDCMEEHDCKYKSELPITNSPRCGECGYCGELDIFGFAPEAMRAYYHFDLVIAERDALKKKQS